MYDLLEKRDQAIQRYQALLAHAKSSDHADLARRCLKRLCSAQ
jgi:hypothetical protein